MYISQNHIPTSKMLYKTINKKVMICVDYAYINILEKKPRGLVISLQTFTCDGRDSREKADLPAKTIVRK